MKLSAKSLVYVAAPYTSEDPKETEYRIKMFCKKDSELSGGGLVTVSPLFKHLLFINGSTLPSSWAYWEQYSYSLLDKCDCLVVLTLRGWTDSPGVKAEIEYARKLGIKIVFIDPLLDAFLQFSTMIAVSD